MASRTQLVCLHEGKSGHSIDPVFINRLIKTLDPNWIRPFKGSNRLRLVDCGGRTSLIKKMPTELKICQARGGLTALMVWADLDHDMADGDQLKNAFWIEAQSQGIRADEFAKVVFIFAKDRLENWIEFLSTGSTDESVSAPRVYHNKQVAHAANQLAARCISNQTQPQLPPSLEWSCRNWRDFAARIKRP